MRLRLYLFFIFCISLLIFLHTLSCSNSTSHIRIFAYSLSNNNNNNIFEHSIIIFTQWSKSLYTRVCMTLTSLHMLLFKKTLAMMIMSCQSSAQNITRSRNSKIELFLYAIEAISTSSRKTIVNATLLRSNATALIDWIFSIRKLSISEK